MKYHIITFGCQMNVSDSQKLAAILENMGYQASPKEKADLIIFNMCSVRQSAVDRIHGKIKSFAKLKKENPKLKIILTGCTLEKDKKQFKKFFDEIWDNKNYFNLPAKKEKKRTALIPISNGCNNFCSYCVVPFTRGPLICRSHKKILKEAKKAVEQGAEKIWLLGQNVNDYLDQEKNKNQKINFAKLIKMVDALPGNFKFFFVSPHPKNFSDELINVLAKCQKFGNYLNLPLQSGDNEILKKMNRPYTVQQYENLVKKIRKKMPKIFLSTDIIVGFPGETKKQFENTKKLFSKIGFNMAYISKYSPRPGTAAYKIKGELPLKEKQKRWKILNNILLKNWKKQEKNKKSKKIIVILGPTSSGKSDMAVKLAKKFNGQIISADSRQVYKGMDIGTGKISKKEMKGIPHHLLDVISPKTKFNVIQYRKLALSAIDKIFKEGKLPIICGGTGFYIQAVIDGIIIPEIKPDWNLRKKLEKQTNQELFKKLKKIDPKRAETIDKNNKRRLIRALEIVIKTKKPIPLLQKQPLAYPTLILGIKKQKQELKELIKKRLLKRLKQGMVKEVKKLRKSGISWKKLEEFGMEYRFVAQHLQNKITYERMVNAIQKENEHYAKRQMTWFNHQIDDFTAQNFSKKNFGEFNRNKRIKWIKQYSQAEKIAEDFLNK
jgi:MiaB/RimO family radical SAM methylthiotransferase